MSWSGFVAWFKLMVFGKCDFTLESCDQPGTVLFVRENAPPAFLCPYHNTLMREAKKS
jgi:hypothetical protein